MNEIEGKYHLGTTFRMPGLFVNYAEQGNDTADLSSLYATCSSLDVNNERYNPYALFDTSDAKLKKLSTEQLQQQTGWLVTAANINTLLSLMDIQIL